MKTLVLLAALVIGWLSLGGEARAQGYVYPYGYPYNGVLGDYVPYAYNNPPIIVTPPTYYVPPYYWSTRYYYRPYSTGYLYQSYFPWTGQYYYQYRAFPRVPRRY